MMDKMVFTLTLTLTHSEGGGRSVNMSSPPLSSILLFYPLLRPPYEVKRF